MSRLFSSFGRISPQYQTNAGEKERKKNSDGRAGPLSAHPVDIHMNVVALLLLLLLSFGRPAQQQIAKKSGALLGRQSIALHEEEK